MKLCEYCQIGDYAGHCTCLKDGDICPLVRRCSERQTWLPLESMGRCARRQVVKKRKEGVELKANEYLVEYVQRGKLYINVDGALIRKANPYDYEPDKVKLVKVGNEYYIEEFAPKEDKPLVEEEDKEEEVIEKKPQKKDTYKGKQKHK